MMETAWQTPAQIIDLPQGKWQLCINGERAGTTPFEIVENQLLIPPISAMVLIKE